jgi:hypothetical protein
MLDQITQFFEAQQVAHPQPQFGAIDRLGQELLSAGIESVKEGARVGTCGHHDDGDVQGGRIRLEDLRNLIAVHAGHHDVEQDQIREVEPDRGQRFVPVIRGTGDITFRAQERLQELTILGLVVNDQNSVPQLSRMATRDFFSNRHDLSGRRLSIAL